MRRGSEEAESVLPAALRLAQPLGMEIVLVRIVPELTSTMGEGMRRSVIEDVERMQEEADAYLRGIAARRITDGLRAATVVRTGDAAEEIVRAAHDADVDLIAMATAGRTGLGRILFGSTAAAVVQTASVPVFLVRHGVAATSTRAA